MRGERERGTMGSMETIEEREARTAAELAEMIAKGWKRSDLRWVVTTPLSRADFAAAAVVAGLPRSTHVLTDEERAASRDARERMRRGMWVISHEAVSARIAERAKQ